MRMCKNAKPVFKLQKVEIRETWESREIHLAKILTESKVRSIQGPIFFL